MSAARLPRLLAVGVAMWSMAGCQSSAPLATVAHVDVPRFMGDWYVIACIPTIIERDAYNAVESYRLASDGRVLTDFTFRAGSFDGPRKHYTPVGYVLDASGATWGMQFVWPIKADYRVIYLDEGYSQVIIGRQKRDHAWIMARRPTIPEPDYARHVEFLRASGYDVTDLRRVPQQSEAVRAASPR